MKNVCYLTALILTVLSCLVACTDTPPAQLPSDDATEQEIITSSWELVLDGTTFRAPEAAGITQEGNTILLTHPGSYVIRGTLSDGQLRVRVAKTERIELVFDGLTATCSTSAPVYIESADKVTVILAEGSVNTLTDATDYVFESGETKPNACLYSSEDITFKGTGKLIINAHYNNGIGSKNDLKIKEGSFEITAVKNALKGNDSVTIENGSILIHRCNDGIKTDAEEQGRGILTVRGGTLEIHATDDALQASREINVSGGIITAEALGKHVNCDGTVFIAEGCLIEE